MRLIFVDPGIEMNAVIFGHEKSLITTL